MTTEPGTITAKQAAFIRRLTAERQQPLNEAELDNLSKQAASEYITVLLALPKAGQQAMDAPRQTEVTVTEPGVYETAENVVYVVKPNRDKTRLYAKRLVEINAERALAEGGRVQIEFEYERGAIFRLDPSMKMPLERAKELTIRYGKCIVCGRGLKAAESVERGIGPVCIKSFRVDFTEVDAGAKEAFARREREQEDAAYRSEMEAEAQELAREEAAAQEAADVRRFYGGNL